MLKRLVPVAALLIGSITNSVQAMPVCYMEMHGRLTDLTHICGDGSVDAPLPATEATSLEIPDVQQPDIFVTEDPATFQVTKARYNPDARITTITGIVVFPQSAEYGEIVWPSVYNKDGSWIADMDPVTRVRGQRRLTVSREVTGRRLLNDLEGRLY
ncbi:MAG: hypothetical protein AAGF93_12235 [Cyanobacteria bacterium P01_H01_bin.105]